ncbi:MAG: arylesterase [Nitrosospira sp.]|nr:arylesterase [Nitrosospira sp.]MDW7642254.1 arylesterase [Nitrosomonadaceae bacterium]MBI0408072.1 arylesterase [Nitrosospira sp.]MBI0414045.1 arylesterase [Nitrosospira sp.]MBI0416874.1 arylesterase [Nitrosospira sp.]
MKNLLFLLSISLGVVLSSSSTGTDTTALLKTATTVMVFGDSLSSSYGIPSEAGWVNLLKKRLQIQSSSYQVINASVSGETTLGGRNNIEQALKNHRPNIVIIELGANDGLRGLSTKSAYENLESIIKVCQRNQITVLLVGMRLPPNYGITYTKQFQDIYLQLAKYHRLRLVPFLLENFGDKPEYFQEDGLHPNTQAQEKILENVWKELHLLI